MPDLDPLQHAKQMLRQSVLAARRALPDHAPRSSRIVARLLDHLGPRLPSRALLYLGARHEIDTAPLVQKWLAAAGQVVVPYCLPGHQLGLFALHAFRELTPGAYGILEPASELRAKREVLPQALEMAILPGVAFDLHGNRLGHGMGYYDRLLPHLRPKCRRVALAFECQIVDEVPTEPHDIPVETIVTEERTIECAR